MSFGRITHHLMAAKQLALKHDATTTAQVLALDAILLQLDLLIAVVRRIYHTVNIGQGP